MLLEGAKIIDFCLFNPTVEGAWIDKKVQKLLGNLKKNSLDPLLYENDSFQHCWLLYCNLVTCSFR